MNPAALVRPVYAHAACWLTGDADGLGMLADELRADPAAVLRFCRVAVVVTVEELASVDGGDTTRLHEELQELICEEPALLRFAEAAATYATTGQDACEMALVPLVERLGLVGAVAAAGACAASAVQVACGHSGADPLAQVRARVLEMAACEQEPVEFDDGAGGRGRPAV